MHGVAQAPQVAEEGAFVEHLDTFLDPTRMPDAAEMVRRFDIDLRYSDCRPGTLACLRRHVGRHEGVDRRSYEARLRKPSAGWPQARRRQHQARLPGTWSRHERSARRERCPAGMTTSIACGRSWNEESCPEGVASGQATTRRAPSGAGPLRRRLQSREQPGVRPAPGARSKRCFQRGLERVSDQFAFPIAQEDADQLVVPEDRGSFFLGSTAGSHSAPEAPLNGSAPAVVALRTHHYRGRRLTRNREPQPTRGSRLPHDSHRTDGQRITTACLYLGTYRGLPPFKRPPGTLPSGSTPHEPNCALDARAARVLPSGG